MPFTKCCCPKKSPPSEYQNNTFSRERHEDIHETLSRHFETEWDGLLRRTVTRDFCRVNYSQPKTKRASKEWPHSSSPERKKFRTTLMPTLLWDCTSKSPVLVQCKPRGTTTSINTELFCCKGLRSI